MAMMMTALSIATVSVTTTDGADVFNVNHYCAHNRRSKMKHRGSSLNSHARLFGMDVDYAI
jgi:hypothetical protein